MHDFEPEEIFQPDIFVDKSYSVSDVDINGVSVQLEALHHAASTDFDLTGQIVWPASRLLSLYLCTRGLVRLQGAGRVLEVGAGVGLAGLVAAKLATSSQEVVLTDNQDEVLQVLERNIKLNTQNTPTKLRCTYLGWGEKLADFCGENGKFDLIIGADVIFWPTAVALLFETAAHLLNPKEDSCMIIAYISRSDFSTKLMYECATKSGFTWDIVNLMMDDTFTSLIQDQKACGRSANVIIFHRASAL